MCGRFKLTATVQDLQEILEGLEATEAPSPRYNVAPTQGVAVVANDAPRRLACFRWGLIPRWAKDASIGSRMINARAETLAERPAFRDLLKRRRCLVLADGFYEWKAVPGSAKKQPYLVELADGRGFPLAGLWDEWSSPEGPLRTCTIVTTTPCEALKDLHDRMPAIVAPGDVARWLSSDVMTPEEASSILVPTSRPLRIRAVSTRVNSPANDSPDCIAEA